MASVQSIVILMCFVVVTVIDCYTSPQELTTVTPDRCAVDQGLLEDITSAEPGVEAMDVPIDPELERRKGIIVGICPENHNKIGIYCVPNYSDESEEQAK